MIVYKLLSSEIGLKVLRELRIKVSLLDDLNDPFELFSVNLSGKEQRKGYRVLKKVLSENIGLLCFSKSYKNPLLWSHYGDKHKGVAIELGIIDASVEDVKYVKSRSKLDFNKLLNMPEQNKKRAFKKILTTKYESWVYENECRTILPKEEFYEEDKISYVDINAPGKSLMNSNVFLSGIVLGPLCKLSLKDIEEALPKGISTDVIKTRLAFNTFNVVKDKSYKLKEAHGRA